MKIQRALALACACTVLPFTAAACGDSYDREEFISTLVEESGITEGQAICITDRAEDEIGVDRLNSRFSDPTDEEAEIITNATIECILGEG